MTIFNQRKRKHTASPPTKAVTATQDVRQVTREALRRYERPKCIYTQALEKLVQKRRGLGQQRRNSKTNRVCFGDEQPVSQDVNSDPRS